MRDVLLHLEGAGFDGAPRWLRVDETGRDVHSWIEGETFTDRSRMHPYIGDPPERITFSDEQLAAVMRLLRRYHDTFVGYGFAAGEPAELVRRTGVALGAYGSGFDVPAILEREYDLAEDRCRRHGWHRQLAKLPVEQA